jgi:hypothetical protein
MRTFVVFLLEYRTQDDTSVAAPVAYQPECSTSKLVLFWEGISAVKGPSWLL